MEQLVRGPSLRRIPLFSTLVLFGLAMAPAAHAFTFQVTELSGCESPGTLSCIGEQITIGVRLLNDVGPSGVPDDIAAVAAAFSGYDHGVVSFVQGTAVSSILDTQCFPTVGCFGGISNLEGPSLSEENGRVQFVNAVTITIPHTDDGLNSPGLDGIFGGGDAQFRVSFMVTGPGITTIQIGTDPSLDNYVLSRENGSTILDTTNAVVVISSDAAPYVVPEPGTALLLGLGFAGLAAAGRTESSFELTDL